jgi:DNA end-binding protein Ku
MRSIWSGAISFGLVNIPVKLYSATGENKLDFDMLHKEDLSPIRYARVCRSDGKEIPYSDIIKGYEYQKGDYVILTDEDFKKANARKTRTIDIIDFVQAEEIDVIYFERPYFLEPSQGAEKAYALLREALRQSKKTAVAKFVLRNREHLAVIMPADNVLVLDQMRFQKELRSPDGLNLPKAEIAEVKEVDMALALIDQLSENFHPKDYKDSYTEELKRVIEEKAKGKTPAQKEQEPEPTKIPDLMQVLRASLERERQKETPTRFH